MKFTIKALLPPFIAWLGYSFYIMFHPHLHGWEPLYTVIMAWGFVAFGVVVIYWLGRIFSRGSRDAYRPR